MKKYFAIIILTIVLKTAVAGNYYFSSANGDDSRTSIQAQNQNTPWKTLDKLNANFNLFKPGDSILFRSGDTFYGTINITSSGTINMPIVLSSYGTGSKPVIVGFTSINSWTSVGNGIYESYNPALGNNINMVVINNVVTPMGRYPNKGYRTFQSHNGNISISDNTLAGTTNWTGAELVVRTRHWVIDKSKINAQSGSTLSYSQPLSYEPQDNFGYFIQNDIRTLDQLGEWYYNPSAKKLSVYFGTSNPSSFDIKAASVNSLVTLYNQNHIVINNLAFTGSNLNGIDISSSSNTRITNCDITYSGTAAITGSSAISAQIENNNISFSNNDGIYFGYNCSNNIIRKNNIKNTLMFAGMCTSGNTTGLAVFVRGKSNLIEYNNIDSTGFTPIRFAEDSNNIKNNYISNFNFIKDDEGAIYTWNNNSNAVVNYGRKITGNIIVNGIGANEGTDGNNSADGIYMDDNSGGVEISGNTISNCNNNGIYIHDAHDMVIKNNTSYNNGNSQIILKYDNVAPNGVIRNIQNNNNIYFAKPADQLVARFQSIANDFSLMGVYDNNFYCRPLNDNLSLFTRDANGMETTLDLSSWKTLYSKDLSSKISPIQLSAYKVNALSVTNKVPNGDFNTGIDGMYVYSTASSYSSSWNSGGKLDGGAFQGVINSSSASTFSPIIAVGSLDASKQYILKFSAVSSKDTVFNVYLRQSGAPYNTISIVKSFHITPARQEYEFLFSYPASEVNASIGFETASQSLNFWLDNVKLFEASASNTNPDDSIRFEFNPTASIKTVTLDKNYIDVKSNKYSGTISLQPYSSLVLMYDKSASVVNTPPPPYIKIVNPLGNAIFNISSKILITTLSLAGSDGGFIKQVDFYSNGVLVGTNNAAPFNFTLSGLPVGSYSITVKATDDNGLTAISVPVKISVQSLNIAPASINAQVSIMDKNILGEMEVKVGPNPASDHITLYTHGLRQNVPMVVSIFSVDGTEVKRIQGNSSNANTGIDISTLSAGSYILRMNCGNTAITRKFIKTK